MNYNVTEIPKQETDEWFLKKHYARRKPCISYAYGLFNNNSLVGVCSYGNALTAQLTRGICGEEYKRNVFELNRLCIEDGLPKNTASYFVSRTLKLLPGNKIIVSYSDMAQGHHGYIYQACNFIYTGVSHQQMDWKIRGKEHLHSRTIMDEFPYQKDRIKRLKEKYGDLMYQELRPPKHRYIYFVGDKKWIKKARGALLYQICPYPKGDNYRYDSSYSPITQGVLFND